MASEFMVEAETPDDQEEEVSDDGQDCAAMRYLGSTVTSIDKILNKLMFDEQAAKKSEYEVNQNIMYDQKRFEFLMKKYDGNLSMN